MITKDNLHTRLGKFCCGHGTIFRWKVKVQQFDLTFQPYLKRPLPEEGFVKSQVMLTLVSLNIKIQYKIPIWKTDSNINTKTIFRSTLSSASWVETRLWKPTWLPHSVATLSQASVGRQIFIVRQYRTVAEDKHCKFDVLCVQYNHVRANSWDLLRAGLVTLCWRGSDAGMTKMSKMWKQNMWLCLCGQYEQKLKHE